MNSIPKDILGEYDIEGIKMSVWINQEERFNIFGETYTTNIIYALNLQHNLHYTASLHFAHPVNLDEVNKTTEQIKKAHANGKLHIDLYGTNELDLTIDESENPDFMGITLRPHCDYANISEVISKIRIATLNEKISLLEKENAELKARLNTQLSELKL
jgi:hypothetical protein